MLAAKAEGNPEFDPISLKRLAAILTGCAAAIGCAGLLGHATGNPGIAEFGCDQPLRAAVALGLIAGAVAVAALLTRRLEAAQAAAGVLVAVGLSALMLGRDFGPEGAWPSPMTAMVLCALGTAVILTSLSRASALAQGLALACLALSVFGLLRTLFGVEGGYPLANWSWITFPAALGLWMLCAALVLTQPAGYVPRLLTRPAPDGVMSRRLMPAVMLVPLALGSVRMLGQRLGLFEPDLGLAGMITAAMVFMSVFIVVTAKHVGRVDDARGEALSSLAEAQAIGGLGSWLHDPRDGHFECSAQVFRICGRERADVAPTLSAFLGLLHEDDRPLLTSHLTGLSLESPTFQIELRMRHADGRLLDMWMRARGEIDSSDSIRSVMGTLLDVTERRRNERELMMREARLSTTLTSIGDAVIATDPEGRVELMNPVAELLTGWTSAEASGRRLSESFKIINERTRAPVESPVDRVLREGRVVGLANHTAITRRDGTERSIADSAAPIRDASGAVLGIVMVFRDITEERLAELERERLRARLIQADRMASLGTMAAGIAHEINNPLSFIQANLSAMERYLDELEGRWASAHRDSHRAGCDRLRETREVLSDCQEGADRVRRIVKDLTMFARGQEDEGEVADVHSVALFSLKMAELQIRPRARIVKELSDVPSVAAGHARLGQVLLNLLVNAAQAIPEGTPERHSVRLATYMENGSERVIIEVSDTGSGIAPEHLPRLFDPFFTTKPVGAGTGLGLAVCHGIIASLGGEIKVESKLGAGTTFRVLLPKAQHTRPDEPVLAPHLPAHRGRIFVIDDDARVGKSIARTLEPDHDVVVMTDAKQALERIIQGDHFDAVLCDLMMPELSGMEIHERLQVTHPSLLKRFIFVTGGAFTPRAQAFLASAEATCISKPIDPGTLFEAIRKILGSK